MVPTITASRSEQDESQMSEDGEDEAGAGPEAEEETDGDQETDNPKHEARAVIDQQPVSPSKLLLSTCPSLHSFCRLPCIQAVLHKQKLHQQCRFRISPTLLK